MMKRTALIVFLAVLVLPASVRGQRAQARGGSSGAGTIDLDPFPGEVLGQQRVPFEFLPISSGDRFGSSVCRIGDLDGDGIEDIAVGTPWENYPNLIGSFWIVYLDGQGKERDWRRIAPSRPIPAGQFVLGDLFGSALASLGDLDGDGARELAVGAPTSGTTSSQGPGKVWILSLEGDGNIRSMHAIGEGESGFGEDLEYSDLFGASVAALGDLDGDGIGDLAVGSPRDDVDFVRTGSVRILFLNDDATVKGVSTIAAGSSGFTGALEALDDFGSSVTGLGDLDGDGVRDLAVGAKGDRIPGVQDKEGSVWILFLNTDGSVREHAKLEPPGPTEAFGAALDSLDFESDGALELLIGAPEDDEVTANTGAAFLISLDPGGLPLVTRKFSRQNGGVVGIGGNNMFGSAVASAGDIDGDGLQDLFIGSPPNTNSTCIEAGVLYRLLLNASASVAGQHEMGGRCLGDERFGSAFAEIGDLTGDGRSEYAIGAPGAGNTTSRGSVWMFSPTGGDAYRSLLQLTTTVDVGFGMSLAALDDIDGDSFPDLAVGAQERLFVFRFGPSGVVRAQRNFLAGVSCEGFGRALAALDDLDGDGRRELACGAPLTGLSVAGGQGRSRAGAVVIVSLNVDGTHRSSLLISELQGGFTGFLDRDDGFGSAVAWLGDLDGDGYEELAVGTPGPVTVGPDRAGTVWILSLALDGSVVREVQIGYGLAGFAGPLALGDRFGSGLAGAGDLDGDGVPELVVAASGDDEDGSEVGTLWVLYLRADATVRDARKLSGQGGVRGPLSSGAEFGTGLALMPSFDAPRRSALFVGAPLDGRVAPQAGVAWVLPLFRR